jgi:GR25 family glycosyltransferase involved in LPS biosynthesis
MIPLPTFIISLPKDQPRYDALLHNLHQHSLLPSLVKPTKITGIYGKSLSPFEKSQACSSLFYRLFISHGMIGCGLSHLKALRVFVEMDPLPDDYALILEDDAKFLPSHQFSQVLQTLQSLDPIEKPDLVHLGGHQNESFYRWLVLGHSSKFCNNNKNLYHPIHLWSTTVAYLVKASAAKIILHHVTGGNMVYHVDMVYQGLIYKKRLKAVGLSQPIVSTGGVEGSSNAVVESWLDYIVSKMLGGGDVSHLVFSMTAMHFPGTSLPLSLLFLFEILVIALLPPPILFVFFLFYFIMFVVAFKKTKQKNTRFLVMMTECLSILMASPSPLHSRYIRIVWITLSTTLLILLGILFLSVITGSWIHQG